jgi:DeoR/GlpR family transcriptional regulator of sugar metabolism
MLARQRQSVILRTVRNDGSARVSDLTQKLGVSDMTIRRDLEVLARTGLIEKVHGGAVLPGAPSSHEPGFEAKSVRELPEKAMIAKAAARLVRPGAAVALSAGTTTYALAEQLFSVPGLTVVTNSMRVASLFSTARPDGPDGHGSGPASVVLTGGMRTPSEALVGPIADLAIRSLHFDLLFLGCHGIDPAAGLTTPNLAESETNRAFVRSARRVIVVADHTKWGIVGLSSFADLDEVDTLVTDEQFPPEARAQVADRVGQLIIADGTPG